MNLVDGSNEPRIGVSLTESDAVLKDARAEKPRNRDRRLIILPGESEPVGVSREEDRPTLNLADIPLKHPNETIADLDARGLIPLTWDGFLAWRKTKCRPFDRTAFPFPYMEQPRILEEIDQATHEFVGEVAELAQLFAENGPSVFFGDLRTKLIDECGDILFCAAWALDSWGLNPLYEATDLEIVRVPSDSDTAFYAHCIDIEGEKVLNDGKFVCHLGAAVINLLLHAQTNAGLLCNSYKKLRFQRREQSVDVQVGRIATVLISVNHLLLIAGSNVEEALKVNQRKLDARYPQGYQAGQGGGIRTGEGK